MLTYVVGAVDQLSFLGDENYRALVLGQQFSDAVLVYQADHLVVQ